MFEAWDMIAGRRDPDLGGAPDLLDVVGVNFYDNNQWAAQGADDRARGGRLSPVPRHIDREPSALWAADHRHRNRHRGGGRRGLAPPHRCGDQGGRRGGGAHRGVLRVSRHGLSGLDGRPALPLRPDRRRPGLGRPARRPDPRPSPVAPATLMIGATPAHLPTGNSRDLRRFTPPRAAPPLPRTAARSPSTPSPPRRSRARPPPRR